MALACTVLLAGCGSVPVSSLWKLRKLSLETLEPAALRAAVVHSPSLQLAPNGAVLTVAVSRQLRLAYGAHTTERLEEKLPLQALHSSADMRPLIEHESPQSTVHLWRIDPAALPRLQALRTRAMAWKGTDDGKRELTLGVELTGCQKEWQHPAGHHHADALCGTGRVPPHRAQHRPDRDHVCRRAEAAISRVRRSGGTFWATARLTFPPFSGVICAAAS